jgi:hypothetical protein
MPAVTERAVARVREAAPPADIRDHLREDHERALARLQALRDESDDHRRDAMLRDIRRAWMIHTLAEESLVYRALEGIEASSDSGASRRFPEHEVIENLFDCLSRAKAGTIEWEARLTAAREFIMRHIETGNEMLLPQLAQRYDAAALEEMGRQFRSACAKLALLEDAKAA